MNGLIKKHWTSLLGALFILSSFIYLLRFTLDQGWITDSISIVIGLLMGAGLVVGGLKLIQHAKRLFGEIVTGLGVAVLYTTFSFAGIYYAIWTPMIVLLCMLAVTLGATLYSYSNSLRILMNIALIGALISPFMLRPENDQVFTLFLYLFVINAAYFYLSIQKQWTELRLISFVGTWIMYIVYYVHFNPVTDGIWSMPFRYAVAAFLFYLVALTYSSWKSNLRFDGLNLYLSFANAVLFGIYSVILLDGIASFAYPWAIMSLMYIGLGTLIHYLAPERKIPIYANVITGLFLFLITTSEFALGMDIKPLVDVYVWLAIAVALLVLGQLKQWETFKFFSVLIWFFIGCYWYSTTWTTPRGEWFGVYIPFLNWGALAWMILAALGFYFSTKLTFNKLNKEGGKLLSAIYSIFSHLIVGGLLTLQVINMFEEYNWYYSFMTLTLSISWGIYAIFLFLWGAYTQQKLFKVFGSIVLIIVAIKTILFDLAGDATIYKVIVLFVLGCISFFITWINNKWQSKENAEENTEENTVLPAEE